MAAIDDAGRGRARDRQAPQIPAEPLRDQIFAAVGYAFAAVALVTGLLAGHFGALGTVIGVLVGVLLVPVNVFVIRGHARLKRRYAKAPDRTG